MPDRPKQPPTMEECIGRVYSFVEGAPQRDLEARLAEKQRYAALMARIGELDGKIESRFSEVKQDIKGLQARADLIDDEVKRIKEAAPPQHSSFRRRPSPMPAPISIPPARVELDTGSFTNLDKAAAQAIIAQKASEMATTAANAAIAQHERDVAAGRWNIFLSGAGKIIVVALATIVVAALGVLGGALLQQASQHPPKVEPPALH